LVAADRGGRMDSQGSALKRRRYRHTAEFRRANPMARAFLAPQRDHPPKVQHPKASA
jgi:hypothetical protein